MALNPRLEFSLLFETTVNLEFYAIAFSASPLNPKLCIFCNSLY